MKRVAMFALLLSGYMATGCSKDPKCEETTGNFICVNGSYHILNSNYATNITSVSSPSIELELTSDHDGYYSVSFSLWNTAFDVIPEAGTYELVSSVPSSGGSRKVSPYLVMEENDYLTYWNLDNSGSSSLHSFTLNVQPSGSSYILSGRFTGSLKNVDKPLEKRSIVVNFENISYTP